MKRKISISVDEEKIERIEELVEEGEFRNKSHAVEKGLDVVLRVVGGGKNE